MNLPLNIGNSAGGKPVIESTGESSVLSRARALIPNLLKSQDKCIEDDAKGEALVTICDSDDDDTSSESSFSSDDDKPEDNTPGCRVNMEIAFIPWEEENEEDSEKTTEVKPPLIREIEQHESISEKPL